MAMCQQDTIDGSIYMGPFYHEYKPINNVWSRNTNLYMHKKSNILNLSLLRNLPFEVMSLTQNGICDNLGRPGWNDTVDNVRVESELYFEPLNSNRISHQFIFAIGMYNLRNKITDESSIVSAIEELILDFEM